MVTLELVNYLKLNRHRYYYNRIDQFDLSGLTELSLGGVTLGGTGATIQEFSIDPLFTNNSDKVVPTQKTGIRKITYYRWW